jgi:hypothetical protein
MVAYRMNQSSSPSMIVGDSAQMRLIDSSGNAKKLGLSFPTVATNSIVQGPPINEIHEFETDPPFILANMASHSVAATFANGVAAQSGKALQVTTNAGVVATISLVASLNLGVLSGVAVGDSDYIHIWINVDNPLNISQIRLLFDVDPNSVSAGTFTATAFKNNFYWASILGSDLQAATQGTTTTIAGLQAQLANLQAQLQTAEASGWFQQIQALQQQISRLEQTINNQTFAGQLQWTEFKIPINNFFRAGGNQAVNWSNVVGWRIEITTVAAVAAVCTFDAMYEFGGLGPDSSVGVGYDWRYTDYDDTTGSEGNPSPLQANAPPTGTGTAVVRSAVALFPAVSTNTRCTRRYHYRRGGTLSASWQRLGYQLNVAPAAITTVVINGAGLCTVTTAAPHGFPNGSAVLVSCPSGGVVSGVVSGMVLSNSPPGSWTPGLTGGTLYAQSTFITLAGAQNPGPAPFPTFGSKVSWLFYNSISGYYYSLTSTPTAFDDCLIGVVRASLRGGTTIVSQAAAFYQIFETITVTGLSTFTAPLTGTAVTYTGGTATLGFLDFYADADIASAPSLLLTNDVPVTTVDSTGATVYEQPLKRIWGPYLGSVIFGCGDPNRPGYLYWLNAGNPDGASSINNVETTQPSDPLQNGFFWGGFTWVFSKENLFTIYPAQLGIPNQYQPLPSACARGLSWSDLCFAAGPDTPAIWFLSKDGIYETMGGPAVPITEDDLWPIFHGLASGPYVPIDFTQTEMLRMAYRDNELFFQYQDINQGIQVLVWNRLKRRWRHATYPWGPLCLYAQPEVGNILLLGGNNGLCYQEDPSVGGDDSQPIACQVRSGSYDQGLALRAKEYVHFILDADPQGASISASLLYNDQTVSAGLQCGPFVSSGSGRQPLPFGLNDYYALNAMVDVSFTTVAVPVLYGFELDYRIDRLAMVHIETPEDSLGIDGWKHVYDGYITVRSNADVSLILMGDGTAIGATTVIPSTAGQKKKTLLQFGTNKFKLLRRRLDSTQPFQVYAEDSVLHVGGWADGQYRNVPLVENVE